MVYSTDPDYKYAPVDEPEAQALPPSRPQLREWRDPRHRGGQGGRRGGGFVGSEADLGELARLLKTRCGVGGAAKQGEIIIQGDHRDRVVAILTAAGYGCKKAGS